jgi:SAM-dependent methyltransferase
VGTAALAHRRIARIAQWGDRVSLEALSQHERDVNRASSVEIRPSGHVSPFLDARAGLGVRHCSSAFDGREGTPRCQLGERRGKLWKGRAANRVASELDRCDARSGVNDPSPCPSRYDAERARTYDYTRGASPTIVRALAKYLGVPAGRSLLDLAGGTGNYAQVFAARGFRVFVVDASLEMLAHARRKLTPGCCLAGDATALPLSDRAVDAALLVHGLHLVDDGRAMLSELRRVVRAGPLVVVDPTSDNVGLFVHEYFGIRVSAADRPSNETIRAMLGSAGFSRVEHERLVYTDSVDGSLYALHTSAMHLAGPAYLRNTSFWSKLDQDTRRSGLAALAADLRSGVLNDRVQAHMKEAALLGHEAVFAAWP